MADVLVKTIPSSVPNCFGYLSNNQNFPSDASTSFGVFSLTSPSDVKLSVVIQVFGTRPPFAYIHINAAFMKLHGIKEFEQVMLHNTNNIQFCDCIEIMPDSIDDWNIIQNTAFVIEEIFLGQIRIVQKGMRFVLNVFDNLSVNFRVSAIIPENTDGPVIVSTTTKVLVVPWEERKLSVGRSKIFGSNNPRTFYSNEITNFLIDFKERSFRILPSSFSPENMNKPFTFPVVIVHEEVSYMKPCIVSLKSPLINQPCFAIKLSIATGVDQNYEQLHGILKRRKHHCWLPDNMHKMGFKSATHIKIRPVTKNLQRITHLLIRVYDMNEENQKFVINSLKTALINPIIYSPIVFSIDGLSLTLPVQIHEKIRLANIKITPHLEKLTTNKYDAKTCFYFWVENVKMDFQFVQSPRKQSNENVKNLELNEELNFGTQPFSASSSHINLSYQNKILEKINKIFLPQISSNLEDSRILITGAKSSGKTTIIAKLAHELLDHELTVFSSYVNLAEWKGKTDSIEKMLNEKLQNLKLRKPSILFLDNLDFLNIHLDDEERKKFVIKIYRKIARTLHQHNDIFIIGTAANLRHLPESMISNDGFRLWPNVFEIPALENNDLYDTLNRLLHFDVSFELKKAESYTVGELSKLAERVRLYAGDKSITSDDVLHVFKNIPTAGRKLQNQTDELRITFSDIGGMRAVKQKLIEVVIWPSKYAELYTRCGIKSANNAILHGPSGCGKSLIMRAIASEAGLNVITIKGPELLSKYIGSSEENVRNVFERARKSRPCLVIFDEFDALAPKRGHDNTGVTDRVVNQLLTELDGVDSSLDGIYVLAASNRMDLIDAALLRPGRFDHKIFCDIPNAEERYEILVVLCSALTLANDVNLHEMARETDGWTGAELRGLVMNAQFSTLESKQNTPDENVEATVIMTWKNFEQALRNSKKQHPTKMNKTTTSKIPIGNKVTLA